MYLITIVYGCAAVAEAVVTDISKGKEAGVLLMIAVGDRDTYVYPGKDLLSLCYVGGRTLPTLSESTKPLNSLVYQL